MLSDLGYALAQGSVYYGVMLALFRFRGRLGLGTFLSALCALTFAENYLAITVFVGLGPFTYTPGSVVLFTGKLLLLLLVYIREDAEVVRQPIYGLLIGNLVIIAVVLLISYQTRIGTSGAGTAIDVVAESTWLSVWGTLLLFVDSIAMILIYERLARIHWIGLFARIWLSVILVLAFDQFAFFSMLYATFGVPLTAGFGGFVGKLVASGLFGLILWVYLRWAEGLMDANEVPNRLRDVFDVLTYRQRFEALNEAAQIDVLTKARNRRALEEEGPRLVASATVQGVPLTLFMIDIDGFKQVNDKFGHTAGDTLLQQLVESLRGAVRQNDPIFRYGGDEFVIIVSGADETAATRMADAIRNTVRAITLDGDASPLSVSVGSATAPTEGNNLRALLDAADRSMYASRKGGSPLAAQ
ncbi:GGDEF domain-containing protein [Amorphus sp. 3PC139-8]|uniref:GGDEF domain-containing protein n=1 Tax=Amorphus sp. 3PC139-8 TaxID=2735676 RepID=UPI00345C76A6